MSDEIPKKDQVKAEEWVSRQKRRIPAEVSLVNHTLQDVSSFPEYQRGESCIVPLEHNGSPLALTNGRLPEDFNAAIFVFALRQARKKKITCVPLIDPNNPGFLSLKIQKNPDDTTNIPESRKAAQEQWKEVRNTILFLADNINVSRVMNTNTIPAPISENAENQTRYALQLALLEFAGNTDIKTPSEIGTTTYGPENQKLIQKTTVDQPHANKIVLSIPTRGFKGAEQSINPNQFDYIITALNRKIKELGFSGKIIFSMSKNKAPSSADATEILFEFSAAEIEYIPSCQKAAMKNWEKQLRAEILEEHHMMAATSFLNEQTFSQFNTITDLKQHIITNNFHTSNNPYLGWTKYIQLMGKSMYDYPANTQTYLDAITTFFNTLYSRYTSLSLKDHEARTKIESMSTVLFDFLERVIAEAGSRIDETNEGSPAQSTNTFSRLVEKLKGLLS